MFQICVFIEPTCFLNSVSDTSVPNVQVTRMSLICESAPNPLVLDLQSKSLFRLVYETKMDLIN